MAIVLQVMKCNERDNFVDNFLNSKINKEKKCRSKSYIDKWFSDKTVMVHIKENWVKYDDF